MFGKVLLFIYAVKICSAVFIDTSENHNKDLVPALPQGWQMVKVYHPPHAYAYKYEPYAYPKYEFEYSVSDKKTGDHKHHHESRDGDRVRGEYSLVESDGSLRKVQYHADDHSGFNAIVSKTVNKHGDHAVSVSDHTRFFYPVGHNIKINHYFPGKNYHHEDIEIHDEASKPVYEKGTNKDVKIMNESADKLMAVEPMKIDDEIKESESTEEAPMMKLDVAEATPVELNPAAVSVIPISKDAMKDNPEPVNSMSLVQKIDVLPAMEMPSEMEKKGDKNDSEVASSYYHSKFYYIIQ